MQPPSTLPELVDQLGKTYSPFERLKILGRAWALLRNMTPEQRMIVAAQLGLDHADEVVAAIAKRSGQQASPALISMIEQAQLKGTPELPALIADLRDPKRRARRLQQGAVAVEAALTGEAAPEVPWLPPGSVSGETQRSAPAAPAAQRREAPRPAAASPAPQARPAPRPVQAPQPPPAPAPVAPQPPPVREEAAPAITAPPSPPAPAPAPEPKQAVAPVSQPVPVMPAAPRVSRPEPPSRTAGDGALAGRLSAVPALTARFRLLRRHLDEAKGMSPMALRSVLEGFPDGWARRRALLELLRGGVLGSLGDALTLVEALGSERDRLWCLGTLADSREIRESDREAFLAAASSPTARRRLERRLGGG